MTRNLVRLACLLLACLTAGIAFGMVGVARAAGHWVPPGDTVVRVRGDAANGFKIHYYDGSVAFPPTLTESMAECGEYDAKVDRVRCRTEVRTWYRDLADMKLTIRYTRLHGRG
jgi:hypothetical protein